jgi:hypothetical protein
MNLTICAKEIRQLLPLALLLAYTSTTEEGNSALNLVVYGNNSSGPAIRAGLINAIYNQYNYMRINRANDEITVYTFEAIKGYSYCIR